MEGRFCTHSRGFNTCIVLSLIARVSRTHCALVGDIDSV